MNVYVLAGGKSSRMGQDKGLMDLNGNPMVHYVLEQARVLTKDITIITSNKEYEQFGFPLIEDQEPNQGPAQGILTGLEHSTKGRNIFLSTDMPLIGIFELGLLENSDENALVCYEDEKLCPFPGLYSKALLPKWKEIYNSGERKMENFIKSFEYKARVTDNRKLFLNVNTPEDFIIASKHLP